jgi:phytanoyl-CoA hydroxylase
MLHRRLEIHERYLLHPRIVDVVAGLVGPDVLALQTMLFVKGPGSPSPTR